MVPSCTISRLLGLLLPQLIPRNVNIRAGRLAGVPISYQRVLAIVRVPSGLLQQAGAGPRVLSLLTARAKAALIANPIQGEQGRDRLTSWRGEKMGSGGDDT